MHKKIAVLISLMCSHLGATTWLVTTTDDDPLNTGSLRYAMIHMVDGDTIHFDPSIYGQTIGVSSDLGELPAITQNNITISASSSTPNIAIDGSALTIVTNANGFTINGSGCTIQGLAIGGFNQPGDTGILIEGTNTTISHCYIGTDITGMTANPNQTGIYIQGNVNVSIVSNLISGNSGYGLDAESGNSASGLVINQNIFGLTSDQSTALANVLAIYMLDWTNATISSNTIAGNDSGIFIQDSNTITIHGNSIGVVGNTAIPNAGTGLDIETSLQASSGFTITNNTISGNGSNGINLGAVGGNISSITIQNNYIGTNSSGAVLGNGLAGVIFNGDFSPSYSITSFAIDNNVISNNSTAGLSLAINISNGTITRNTIEHNGEIGISIAESCQSITIGGTSSADANTIAFNTNYGIELSGFGSETVSGITILGNALYGNTPSAIRIGSGNNDDQQPPTLTSAVFGPSAVQVSGTAPSTGTPLRIEFYATQPTYASTNPQGQIFLGAVDSVSSSSSFTATVPASGLTTADYITAIATSSNGATNSNSSRFSPAITPTQSTSITVTSLTAQPATISAGASSLLTALFTGGTSPYSARWSDGISVSNISSPTTHAVSPSTTTAYTVTIADSLGDSATSSPATVTVRSGTTPFAQRLIEKYHSRVS